MGSRRRWEIGSAAATAALAVALTLAAPAAGKPDLRTRVSTTTPPYTWEADGQGVPGGGVAGCDGPGATCQDVLIDVTEGGDLVVQVEAVDASVEDLDLSLHRSNADGDAGAVVEQQGNCRAYEKVRTEGLAPGFYLARTRYATGAGTHRGTIALLAPGAPAPPFAYESIERRGVLGPSAPTFAWQGTATGSEYCTSESGTSDSDHTLLRLASPGDLRVNVADTGKSAGLEFYVNRSDETGFQGRYLTGAAAGPRIVFLPNLAAGWIRVTVGGAAAAGGSYDGLVNFTPRTVPAPTQSPSSGGQDPVAPGAGGGPASPGGGRDDDRVQGTPGSAPARERAAGGTPRARIRRVPRARPAPRVLRGTAYGRARVARVDIALVRRGRPCRQADVGGRLWPLARCAQPTLFVAARGTSRWSFALPRRLPRGRYVAYARAVDTLGTVGPVTRRNLGRMRGAVGKR